MNYWASVFPPPDPKAVYRAWYNGREVTFSRVPGETIYTTGKRLLDGKITGTERVS